MPKPVRSAAAGRPRVRKNMDMNAAKLSAAQELLGTRTETETVDAALDYVLFQGEVMGALDRLAAAGGLDDIYGAVSRPARRRVAER